MAMINCPGCKRIVSDASGKCPNCGKALKSDAMGSSTPAGRFRIISSALIVISFVLLLIEFFDVAKTYIGVMLLGVGIFMHGASQSKLADDESYIGRRKVIGVYIAGVIIFVGGIAYLVVNLSR